MIKLKNAHIYEAPLKEYYKQPNSVLVRLYKAYTGADSELGKLRLDIDPYGMVQLIKRDNTVFVKTIAVHRATARQNINYVLKSIFDKLEIKYDEDFDKVSLQSLHENEWKPTLN